MSGVATPEDWKRLGRVVLDRRVELGMRTREAFAEKVGLSTKTLGEIERGARTSYDAGTLSTLELALGWPKGHVEKLLRAPNGPAELATAAGIARYIYRDDLVLVALLERSGLDEAAVFRLILRVRARREQQNADLLGEVAGLIREAGGHAPDPAYPPTWLFDGSDGATASG